MAPLTWVIFKNTLSGLFSIMRALPKYQRKYSLFKWTYFICIL